MERRPSDIFTPIHLIEAAGVLAVIVVTILQLHPALLLSSTTITGGDTGSHLAMPAYLRTQGNLFNLTPWYPGWFAGMPAYTYYFVLPDVLAVLASYVINFAVAFKLATVLGSVLMPIMAYCMGRLFRAPRPVPLALAMATLPFLFDASFTIDGGNLFSTMAGEYAFSLSLALCLVTIGLFARGVRTGRGYWAAALALSATLASHVLPWFFTIAAVGVLVVFELLQRRGIGDPREERVAGDYARPFRFALGAGLLSGGLSAWWLFSFIDTQNLTNSMGYTNVDVSTLHAVFSMLGWFNDKGGAAGDRWVIVLAAIALIVAFWVRDRLGMVLVTLVGLSLLAFVLDPQSVIWNQRLVPFWFISIYLSAGWLVGYTLARWTALAKRRRPWLVTYVDEEFGGYEREYVAAEHEPARETVLEVHEVMVDDVDLDDPEGRTTRRTARATVAIMVIGLLSTLPGLVAPVASAIGLNTSGNQVASWANLNYAGYQKQPAWPEYHDLMTTMARVAQRYGCGRAMWEYSIDEQRFGTPMALMLLPYWTNNCVGSMEGLFFESSATTPYHFLDQAELSVSPSNPQLGLNYGQLDVALGVQHLQMLGVKYYIAYSPSIIRQADRDPALRLIASTKPWPSPGVRWRIYLIKNSPLVVPLATMPNVVSGITSRVGWLSANEEWWLNSSLWPVLGAESGPATWPRAASIQHMQVRNISGTTKVGNVKVGTQTLSFHVSRVGVPVLVKISYFPRWKATGAAGPYRVSPNLMVVVPTSHDVSLIYASTPALFWGNVVSDVAVLAGLVVLWLSLKRRKIWRK